MKEKISILGTGAWGTALANVLLENNHIVQMWGIDLDEINDLKQGINKKYFGNKNLVKIPDLVTNDLSDAIKNTNIILLAIPSKFLINTLHKLKPILKKRKVIIINVAKGIDIESKKFWSDIIKANFKENNKGIVSLLGPSFATEVFDKEVTVINAVSSNFNVIKHVQKVFNNKYFNLVPLENELGAEIFAALKNVAAIGTGITYYLHNSINTRSAMLTSLFKEIYTVYLKLSKTKKVSDIGYELCAIGDLTLTCTNEKSRNFTFGLMVGEFGVKKALEKNTTTVEGYIASSIVYEILQKNKIKAPLLESIYKILYKKINPNSLIKSLLNN
ncbi:NAD(P)H-dependent glycerol-3-phosphate dehydrogenase [Mycoplasmoides alvi]|uniref:NAD(P)H-dependent glycerol-3-phosphate dehydrogenase n=1 Tax=Mycoplasmoides alvi TaxID=78580 RepID=UPI00051C2397|nr:NAD(P)H-dependent glycerol-3-phosphate dehydrogenase [Mycoplasmoides alvi]